MDFISDAINEFVRQQVEYREKALAEMITKYDFIVGSVEMKRKLTEILPEGANIACMPECFIFSPHIASPVTIYAVKKFDILDLLKEPYKPEE